MPHQDPRFPQLIQVFFPEFLDLFFPEWAARLDLPSTQWMKPDQLPHQTGESTQPFDLVAKLKVRASPHENAAPEFGGSNSECFVVLYFDFAESGAPSDKQMPTYHLQLHQLTGLPVLPLVIYGRAKSDGVGILSWRESFFDLETQVVRYLYVALKGLSGIDYLATGNPIGVALATLMAIAPDKVVWLGAEALRTIFRSNRTDAEKFLLGEFIQANLPLYDAQKQAFEDLLATEPYAEIANMNQTSYEKGVQQGLITAVLASLEGRFDNISAETSEKVASLEQPELLSLLRAIPRADLIEDLPLMDDHLSEHE
jgi:hypothetical protein